MEDIKNKLADKEAEQVSGGFREEIDYSGKRAGIGSDDGGAIYNSGSLTIPDGAYYNVKVGENFPDAVAPSCSHDINISGDAAY